MQEFYRNRLSGMQKDAALAAAGSTLVSEGYTNPFFEAPVCADGRVSPLWQIQQHREIRQVPRWSTIGPIWGSIIQESGITTSMRMDCVLDRATRFKASRPGEAFCAML
jgi:hypothetical protein